MSTIPATSGALLVGGLVSFWLFGMQTVQTYLYFENYRDDALFLKILVAFLCFIDTVHTIFTGHMLWHFLIENFSEPAGMRPRAWSFNSTTALTAIVAFTVQCFIARRIYILNRSFWQRMAAVFMGILALLPLACGLACTTIMVFIRNPALYKECTAIIGTWLASTATVDVLMAALLSFTLYNARMGIKETDTMVTKLIVLVVNTAVLTSGVAFADLATFWTLGNSNLAHWALNINLSKLYVNTLLATLNARHSMFRQPRSMVPASTIELRAHDPGNVIQIHKTTVRSTEITYTDDPSKDFDILPMHMHPY
ncbi:hypothetical protein NEOLEDRAFT_1130514 [Neolentinus lepideus HHB14362 ss-1]|uniref:DUF6534 domain-containing protein n=1 Tax=Neolentinus lepideus HHB14362 ss-1 TaxID=1314782 RepID=A0A165U2C5_9AGAM|nr:hypothetical protein NEOLEDRAFT_1130514 [Neolentinus lepideus HHB14362 ss-1]